MTSASFTSSTEVVASSDKDLSNVVIKFCDGTTQKFDNLSGLFGTFSGTGEYNGKKIVGIWIKSGCNSSDEGPGFGEFHENPNEEVCECEGEECNTCEGEYDECGVCNGNGPAECGCNLDIVKDDCGECGGNNSTCLVDICLNGETIQVTSKEFFEVHKPNGAYYGECLVSVCVMKKLTSLYAEPKLVTESTANDLVSQGLAVKGNCDYTPICRFTDPDYPLGKVETVAKITLQNWLNQGKTFVNLLQCDPVTLCVDGETVELPRYLADQEILNGAEEGECSTCPTEDICRLECEGQFPLDPGWIPPCIESCVKGCGNFCNPLEEDCIYEPLEPNASAAANGFLNQVNIATAVNLSMGSLDTTVSYNDMSGNTVDSVNTNIPSNLKQDFIINDLGLLSDTIGTVRVNTDALDVGQWLGGVTLYKSNERTGSDVNWGQSGFDFALYYPFKNPTTGIQAAPVNTFKLGASLTAVWIRLIDAEKDGNPLMGTIFIYGNNYVLKGVIPVFVDDAGRRDYPAHEYLESNSVGTAVFVPKSDSSGNTPKFYFSSARYFYDCPGDPTGGFGCNNFLNAFALPPRTPIKGKTFTGVTTVGVSSVVEVINPIGVPVAGVLRVYDSSGSLKLVKFVNLRAFGTHHELLNLTLSNESGYVEYDSGDAYTSAVVVSYNFDSNFVLKYGYSTPLTQSPDRDVQISEFNTFLGQSNTIEIANPSGADINVSVNVIDYLGAVLLTKNYNLSPNTVVREELFGLPTDTYGTINVHGKGVVFRNYVNKSDEYLLPFIGK